VLRKQDYEAMNRFDTMSRGYDHTETRLLIKVEHAGLCLSQTRMCVFHPGIAANSREELDEMQFQSTNGDASLTDTEKFITGLNPPYKADINMNEVTLH
jgi:hypothetical protein